MFYDSSVATFDLENRMNIGSLDIGGKCFSILLMYGNLHLYGWCVINLQMSISLCKGLVMLGSPWKYGVLSVIWCFVKGLRFGLLLCTSVHFFFFFPFSLPLQQFPPASLIASFLLHHNLYMLLQTTSIQVFIVLPILPASCACSTYILYLGTFLSLKHLPGTIT